LQLPTLPSSNEKGPLGDQWRLLGNPDFFPTLMGMRQNLPLVLLGSINGSQEKQKV